MCLLLPAESDVLPKEVDLSVQLSEGIKLNIQSYQQVWTQLQNQKWQFQWLDKVDLVLFIKYEH